MENRTHLEQEIKEKLGKAEGHREDLERQADWKVKQRKNLTLAAALLALFSGGTMTTVLVVGLGYVVVQWVAALVAFVSSFMSLYLRIYVSEDDTKKMYAGGTKFNGLANSAKDLLDDTKQSEEQLRDRLSKLRADYNEVREEYRSYYPD